MRGEQTPIFFGSAMTNFGVQLFLDTFMDLGAPPIARALDAGATRGGAADAGGFTETHDTALATEAGLDLFDALRIAAGSALAMARLAGRVVAQTLTATARPERRHVAAWTAAKAPRSICAPRM